MVVLGCAEVCLGCSMKLGVLHKAWGGPGMCWGVPGVPSEALGNGWGMGGSWNACECPVRLGVLAEACVAAGVCWRVPRVPSEASGDGWGLRWSWNACECPVRLGVLDDACGGPDMRLRETRMPNCSLGLLNVMGVVANFCNRKIVCFANFVRLQRSTCIVWRCDSRLAKVSNSCSSSSISWISWLISCKNCFQLWWFK